MTNIRVGRGETSLHTCTHTREWLGARAGRISPFRVFFCFIVHTVDVVSAASLSTGGPLISFCIGSTVGLGLFCLGFRYMHMSFGLEHRAVLRQLLWTVRVYYLLEGR
jgi:hypothetical protein